MKEVKKETEPLDTQPPSQRGDGPEGRGESPVRQSKKQGTTSAGATMKIIGLTGGIACGKSTVSSILKQLDAAWHTNSCSRSSRSGISRSLTGANASGSRAARSTVAPSAQSSFQTPPSASGSTARRIRSSSPRRSVASTDSKSSTQKLRYSMYRFFLSLAGIASVARSGSPPSQKTFSCSASWRATTGAKTKPAPASPPRCRSRKNAPAPTSSSTTAARWTTFGRRSFKHIVT